MVSHKVYFASDPGVDEQYTLTVDGDDMDVMSSAHPDASLGLSILWRVMCRMDI